MIRKGHPHHHAEHRLSHGQRPAGRRRVRQWPELLSVQHNERKHHAVALTEDNRLVLAAFESTSNMITGEVSTERFGIELPPVEGEISQLLLEVKQRDLYVVHGGRFVSITT
jgi:ABC-type uncharacterized transport system permease subunit